MRSCSRAIEWSAPLLIALSVVLLAVPSAGAAPQRHQQADGPPREANVADVPEPIDFRELPWQVRLGLRVNHFEQVFPLIDRVVLVPDAATFLDEIGRWSPAGRWPILIEDDQYAAMFIRRFQPAEVIRRESVGQDELPRDAEAMRTRMQQTLIRTWGGDPSTDTIEAIFERNTYRPPGVVFTSTDDSAWPAALALAAGRGQPLAWIDGRLRGPHAALDHDQAMNLAEQIAAQLDELGYPWRSLDDGVNAITICRTMAGRVEAPRPDTRAVEPLAMTDYLGRHENGERYAIVGWIFGDETRACYIAMCSLFLSREHITLINTYPNAEGFRGYEVEPAVAPLEQSTFTVETRTGASVNRARWLRGLAGGITSDVIVMNSRGNARVFHVHDGETSALDVPILNHPTAVQFTHSWSMRSPNSDETVAGQWLERGVYAYVGAVHEPFLQAFVPPEALARRWTGFMPFLVAARHFDAPPPIGGPWRVNTFGDPLMLCAPPEAVRRERVRSPANYGEDLRQQAMRHMRSMQEDDTGEAVGEAIRLLALLGRDEIALELWAHAQDRGFEASAADHILGSLFRKGDHRGFLEAWKLSGKRDEQTLTMLWHLWSGRLQSLHEEDDLVAMQSAVRRAAPQVDLERLAPVLSRRLGRAHARALIERELERTDNRRAQRAIRDLLRDY